METTTEKNTATFTHLSSLTQYFIPFGNYIFPILIWSSKKDKSEFVDHNGKQVLNFQLSLLLYSLVLIMIAVPTFLITFFKNIPFEALINDHDIVLRNFSFEGNIGMLTVGLVALFIIGLLKIVEFFLIIYAAIKTSNGEKYNYPITIPFIK
ncbi:DUF4870 domain-containing protein [Flavobacterium gawalongense]|uniref:DUF4870 domain-containing protein n=1 Tax=Flavobacterium gawalongense TaxID=2594432 RepID=A0A553BZJ3_9FLAO|nr:DUF4870 domain-containing protein [Flavobacterium gawalongense]TRX04656.1 DUF4870 domain-containing protein [Flavobacterium gawalongense]TRX10543.1 DUF4870 domain-containing protein [Flavobacterium gawalongense]TRX13586.1 DUF4870 domain-containing protein [Flavobacterium gawalongense]TRX15482.1 DUF4870 domain-containing protein [Flavobacterium gawalongense]TRX31321.1 DUF4870 domain-containing protein [Flavobacterium gawalongense]